jgi:glutathione synthase/RimK-type ligase-like ATP-grasp enzyme
MSNVLITMAEDAGSTTGSHFAVRFSVDENDCYDFSTGLKQLGHRVLFVNWNDLSDGEFIRMFDDNAKRFIEPIALSEIDLAFVYKMEGFYFDLPRFLSMVETFERKCGTVVNAPATITHNLDKRYLWQLAELGIRVIPTFEVNDSVRENLAAGGSFVMKPIRGERGNGIFLATCLEDLEKIIGKEHEYLAQQYMPSIRDGERSLVYLGHEFQHAVLKRPSPQNPAEFRCNESLGGTVEVYEPRDDELEYCANLLSAYEGLGCPVHFSRIDIIESPNGPVVLEAELLNPSIYANYSKKGAVFGRAIAQYFDELVKSCSRSTSAAHQ